MNSSLAGGRVLAVGELADAPGPGERPVPVGGRPGQAEADGGELAEFVVDEREQLGRDRRVAGRGGVEQPGDVGHDRHRTVAEAQTRPFSPFAQAARRLYRGTNLAGISD